MSQLFGEIRQMAFVVRDIDQAMQYWTKVLGVGPFFVKRDKVTAKGGTRKSLWSQQNRRSVL